MKKLIFSLTLFVFSVILYSCTKTDSQPFNEDRSADVAKISSASGGSTSGREVGTPACEGTIVTLIAGQTIDAGNVTVTNDANFIYVTYNTANGYVLTQTHLYVGECALIPVNRPGNPIPGQFPYAAAHSNVTSYTYQIPILAIPVGSCGCIAAHAVVKKYNAAGQVIDQQTAWGNGVVINPDGQWGMKFNYCSCQ